MKPKINLLLTITFSISLFIGCNTNLKKANSEKEIIKIGMNVTLTGGPSYWANEFKKGFDLSIEEANNTDSVLHFSILYEDNQGKSDEAVSIMKKFIDIDKTDLVVGLFTNTGNSIKDIAENSKMPLIMSFTSASDFAKGYNWVYRDFTTQDELNPPLADYVFKSLKLKKGAIYVVNDDYGLTGSQIFYDKFISLGGEISYKGTFDDKETNHKNEIYKIIKNNPDFIYILGRGTGMVAACKQVKEIDKNILIVGQNGFESEAIWNDLNDVGEGIIFTNIVLVNESLHFTNFSRDFEDKYSSKINYVNIYGYTIGKYVTDIFSQIGSDKDEFLRRLNSLQTNTLRGEIKMTNKWHVKTPIGIYVRENGISKLVSTDDGNE